MLSLVKMQSTYFKYIATLLLICFSIVFVHSLKPHSHNDKDRSEARHHDQHHQHDQHHSNSHSHSMLSDFFDFFKDISHTQIGENHLKEFLTTPKQFSPSHHYDHSDNVWIHTHTSLDFPPGTDIENKRLQTTPSLKTYHFSDLCMRGPPNRS